MIVKTRSRSTIVSNSSITITVKLFAAFSEAWGVSELTLEFPSGTPVSAVLEHSIAQHPQLEQWRDRTRFGLNLEFVSPNTPLQDGDEVVLIPPVSGG
jgi:molybdopterin synthase sulfur carrier subunit